MRATPILVSQRRDNDCGLAAVATVAGYYGLGSSFDALGSGIELDEDGTDLLTLARLARCLGLRAHGAAGSYDAMAGCRMPLIAHLRPRRGPDHFVVLYRWAADRVLIADPARGLYAMSRTAFCRRWTGYLLLVEPPARDIPHRGTMKLGDTHRSPSDGQVPMGCLRR